MILGAWISLRRLYKTAAAIGDLQILPMQTIEIVTSGLPFRYCNTISNCNVCKCALGYQEI